MGENGSDKNRLWRMIFIGADILILLALFIGFWLLHSGNGNSGKQLSSEVEAVQTQLSEVAQEQAALSEKLAALQTSVLSAEAGEEVKTALGTLQSSYDTISEKVDGIAAAVAETEVESEFREEIASLKKQSDENQKMIGEILSSVQDEDGESLLSRVVSKLEETEEVLTESAEELQAKADGQAAAEAAAAAQAEAATMQAEAVAALQEQNQELSGKLDEVLSSVNAVSKALETEAVTEGEAQDLPEHSGDGADPDADGSAQQQAIEELKQQNNALNEKLDASLTELGRQLESILAAVTLLEEEEPGKTAQTADAADIPAGEINAEGKGADARLTGDASDAKNTDEAAAGMPASETGASKQTTLAQQVKELKEKSEAQQESLEGLAEGQSTLAEQVETLSSGKEALGEDVAQLNETLVTKGDEIAVLKEQTQAVSEQLENILAAASDTSATDGISESIVALQTALGAISEKLEEVSKAVSDADTGDTVSDKLTGIGSRYDTVEEKLADIQSTIVDWRESEAAETETDPILAYVVKKGDTLLTICSANGIDYYANKELLQELNGKENLSLIEPGETLILPGVSGMKK